MTLRTEGGGDVIIGIGLDLCPIARAGEMLGNARFMQRVFTQGERDYIASRGAFQAQSAAGIYAAKEAALKALGTGIGPEGTALCQAEVVHARYGVPQLLFHDAALERLHAISARNVHLSITHDGAMAAAVVITEGE